MKPYFSSITLILLSFLLVGCSENDDMKNNKVEPCKDIVLSRSQQNIVDSQARFAFEFFKETSAWVGPQNVVISPLSLSIDLAMLANGAGDSTYNDIVKAIKLPNTTPNELNALYKMLVDELLEADSRVELSISNGMWNNIDVNIKDAFATNIMTNYDATIQTLDFNDEAKTKEIINGWASKKTSGKITDIFEEENITANGKLILCNAVYFNGRWDVVFDKNNTQKKPFNNISNLKYNVETMHSETSEFMFGSTETANIIRLPYGNKAFSMYFIVPTFKEGDNGISRLLYDHFVESLDYDWWISAKEKMNPKQLSITIPKFKIDTKCPSIGLTMLRDLAPLVLSPNLSRMTDSDINTIIIDQFNSIEVAENGTTAASVTKITAEITAAPIDVFKVDRPFIFLVEEQSTGAILFMGKVVKL